MLTDREIRGEAMRAERRDLERADASDLLARIERMRQMAPRAEPETPASIEAARTDKRRARLVRYGVDDVDAIRAIASAPHNRPPVVRNSPANVAAWRAVWKFSQDTSRRTLGLLGTPGTGKSWASYWLLADRDDAMLLNPGEVRRSDRWAQKQDAATRVPLLLVEDPGERIGEWEANELSEIMRVRHDRARRTILTANLVLRARDLERGTPPRRSVEVLLGGHIVDRLLDARYGIVETCVGESLRQRPT